MQCLILFNPSLKLCQEKIRPGKNLPVSVCVCVQAELEMESVMMARKQLFQQWNSSLVGMKKRDEAFAAMQEAVR